MADALFDKIWENLKKFEKGHTKIKNEYIFDLFQNYGIPFLQAYFHDAEKFEYEMDENGITIKIVTPELVMIPDKEELLELFKLAGSCFIKPTSDHKLCIQLWVRGWLWIKNDCCSDINET